MGSRRASGGGIQTGRVLSRKQVGPLRRCVVADRTLKAYNKACSWFFLGVLAIGFLKLLPSETWEIDNLVCSAIECHLGGRRKSVNSRKPNFRSLACDSTFVLVRAAGDCGTHEGGLKFECEPLRSHGKWPGLFPVCC